MIYQVLFGITLIMLLVSVFYCIKFAIIIIKTQENVEKSLDILDEKYEDISNILTIPLFHDSQEIRRVLQDIDIARQSVLEVAAKLSLQEEEED